MEDQNQFFLMSNIVAQRTNGQWRKRNGSWGSRDVWGSEKNEDETKFGVCFLDLSWKPGNFPRLKSRPPNLFTDSVQQKDSTLGFYLSGLDQMRAKWNIYERFKIISRNLNSRRRAWSCVSVTTSAWSRTTSTAVCLSGKCFRLDPIT